MVIYITVSNCCPTLVGVPSFLPMFVSRSFLCPNVRLHCVEFVCVLFELFLRMDYGFLISFIFKSSHVRLCKCLSMSCFVLGQLPKMKTF